MKALRPFTKIVAIAPNSNADIELLDSDGNAILCNHIEVYPDSNSNNTVIAQAYFHVSLSGIDASKGLDVSDTGALTLGHIGKTNSVNKHVVFNLDYGDECSAINIETNYSNSINWIINYGVLKPKRNKHMIIKNPNLGSK